MEAFTNAKEEVAGVMKKDRNLNKNWGAKVPNFIPMTFFCVAAFVMAAMMKGDWLFFLALVRRAKQGEQGEQQEDEMAAWIQQRFDGFWSLLAPVLIVGYVSYFGIGGYLHWKYYVGQRDKAHEWKTQPTKWLSRKDEIHEILVGGFSLTIGSVLNTALAAWVMNGGYTSLYFEWNKHGILWTLLELPLAFVATDYGIYWIHRLYHLPFMYKHFHKLHHTYKTPTAFSVTAIHPFEFLNIQAIYYAPMFVMPMHVGFFIFYLQYLNYHGLIDHSGVHIKSLWFQPWQPGPIFHDNHHQYFHVNFGINLSVWDKWHGTIRKKENIYREDIFYGQGKALSEATETEITADLGERMEENPTNKEKFL